jgi:hypothetical protein
MMNILRSAMKLFGYTAFENANMSCMLYKGIRVDVLVGFYGNHNRYPCAGEGAWTSATVS